MTDPRTFERTRALALATLLGLRPEEIVTTYSTDNGMGRDDGSPTLLQPQAQDRLDAFAAANPHRLHRFDMNDRYARDTYFFDAQDESGLCVVQAQPSGLRLWRMTPDEIVRPGNAWYQPLDRVVAELINWKKQISHLHGVSPADAATHTLIERHINLIGLKQRELALTARIAADAASIRALTKTRGPQRPAAVAPHPVAEPA